MAFVLPSTALLSLLATGSLMPQHTLRPPFIPHITLRSTRQPCMAEAEATATAYKPPPLDASQLSVGQTVACTILGKVGPPKGSKRVDGYTVDIGAAKPAFLPRSHVALRPNATSGKGYAELPIGGVLEGEILSVEEGGQVNVSLTRVANNRAWARVMQLVDLDVTLKAQVLRFGDAGATLDLEGLPAFLPWSHWPVPPEQRTRKLHRKLLPVKFLEASREKRRLVVSNRRVKLESATASLEPGALVEGTVKSVKEYGAVVSLDSGAGLKGLLHVSQISQVFVKDVSACFAEGDPVCAVVIKVDPDDGSISLSTKMLESKPGEMLRDASAVCERAREKLAGE